MNANKLGALLNTQRDVNTHRNAVDHPPAAAEGPPQTRLP